MRWARRLLIAVSVAIVLIGAAIIVLVTIDLGRFKSNLEIYVSEATGRDFVIAGRFDPAIGKTIDLVAEDVRLANADWGVAGNILELERVVVSIDTWSLLSGPIEVLNLEVQGLSLHVEKDPETMRSSWSFGDADESEDEAGDPFELPLWLRHARLQAISVTYGQGWLDRLRTVAIDEASLASDQGELLTVDLTGSAGEDSISADGLIGPLPALLDGRDPRWDINVRVGNFVATTTGSFEDLFNLRGPDVHADMNGPSAENVLDRLGLPPLARGTVDLSASLADGPEGVELRIEGSFGDLQANILGRTADLGTLEDTEFSIDLQGPNLQAIGALIDADFLPAGEFRVTGNLSGDNSTVDLQSVVLTAGDARLQLDGKLAPAKIDPDAWLRLTASGPAIHEFLPPILDERIPSAAFDIQAVVAGEFREPKLRQLNAKLGDDILIVDLSVATITLAGPAAIWTRFDDAAASIDLRGRNLQAVLEPWLDVALPAIPFGVDGRLNAANGALQLSNISYHLGGSKGTLDGTLGQFPSLNGLQLTTSLAGPNASQFAELLGGLEDGAALPATEFKTHGSISKSSAGWSVDPWVMRIGESQLEFSGALGNFGDAAGINVEIALSGPDLRRFLPNRDIEVPVPYRLKGGLQIGDTAIQFKEVDVRIGEATAWFDGRLPSGAELTNAEFDLRIAGPNLGRAAQAFNIQNLPADAFRFEGAFERDGRHYSVENLTAVVGDNDLAGNLRVEVDPAIRIAGQLESNYLNLTDFFGADEGVSEDSDETPVNDRLIPDTPIPLDFLDVADVDLTLQLGHLVTNRLDVGDLELAVNLADDELHIDTTRVTLSHGGTLSGSFDLVRKADASANVELNLAARQMKLRSPIAGSGHPVNRPLQDLTLEFSGSGHTFRELAARANGLVDWRLGQGDIDNRFGGYILRDFFSQVFAAINPLAGKSEYTHMECGFVTLDIVNGVAKSRAIGLQTDQLAVASLGQVDLTTEAVDLSFRIKQRKGVGVSVASVVNPYVKVGGTLAEPAIKLDTKRGLISGTIATLTGGLSILAQGVWDRYLSRDDYCQAVIEALESGDIPAWEGAAANP